ncbi:hypothetical protein [Natronomonas marina]|uniref:hypothetical protein n=1 Tax=Natronomonas marina TaxID=2961939 RepID=UPI0020CA2257|nr:hypothetical protein [Natronomonas marina]
MVDEELGDGERIARLLSSEVHGHERGVLGRLSVVDARDDVEQTEAGTFAYAVEIEDGRRLAEAYVHPDRAHIEFLVGVQRAADAGHGEGLRVRPKAVAPPRTLVFVENGAEVKPALRVVRAVAEALEESG